MLHTTPAHLREVARSVGALLGDHLDAPIFVVDPAGLVAYATEADLIGRPFRMADASRAGDGADTLRVPLAFGGLDAEVVVGPPRDGSSFPVGLARSLVEMVIGQVTLTFERRDQPHLVDNLVYELLLGRLTDAQAIARHAELVGLDLAPPRAVLVVDCLSGAADGHAAANGHANGHASPPPATAREAAVATAPRSEGVGRDVSGAQTSPRPAGTARDLSGPQASPRPAGAGLPLSARVRRGARVAATFEAATARPEGADLARRVIETTVGFFSLPNATICSDLGNGEVAILKASDRHNLEAWARADDPPPPDASWADLRALKRAATDLLGAIHREVGVRLTIGVGRYHPGLWGMRRSYWDAQHGLRIGRRVHGDGHVYLLPELGPAAFLGLGDPQTKLELARHLLAPLADEPVFYHTVVAYLAEERSASAAAEHLNIHRNTLNYRLDRIAALTGLDPRQFEAAVMLRLSVLALTLYG